MHAGTYNIPRKNMEQVRTLTSTAIKKTQERINLKDFKYNSSGDFSFHSGIVQANNMC